MIAAVVLAAGAANRFGSPKQILLTPYVLAALRATTCVEDIVVVTGAHPFDPLWARAVHCPEWERGPGASLRCGVSALGEDVEAAVVALADGPHLNAEAVDRVAAAWRAGPDSAVAASYGGVRGHPVVLGRSAWGKIPDDGARSLPARLVPCDDLGDPGDVDTPADL
jgi:CTP:molybdopterin cytidylyltransferase MocA